MKHYFIINPVAGKTNSYDKLKIQIEELFKNRQDEYEIYLTKSRVDAYRYCKEKSQNLDTLTRFYACGGDGTTYEVTNGIANNPNVSLGVVPVGSCNDFLKTFPEYDFDDLEKLVNGNDYDIDVIRVNDLYSINVANAGFDARVNDDVTKMSLKHKNVKKAYSLSIVKNLLKKYHDEVVITADGIEVFKGRILLMACANASYYGGGYKCAPFAKVDDGLIETVIFKNVSTLTLARLISLYKKGLHINNKKFANIISYSQNKKVVIDSKNPLCFCLDGETIWDTHFDIEILPKNIKMVYPKK